MAKFNPFRPHNIVNLGMFAGRSDEIRRLEQALIQTRGGNPMHFLVDGERGIGKSSLMLVVECLADGTVTSFNDDKNKYQFVVADVDLEHSDGYLSIIYKIASEVLEKLKEQERLATVTKGLFAFLGKFEAFGVKYNPKVKTVTPEEVLDELIKLFVECSEKLCSTFDGILVLIDEADAPPVEAKLGALLKAITERLTKQKCPKICFGISGVTGLVEKIVASHESASRIYEIITLLPLKPDDCREAIALGLADGKKHSGITTEITEDAIKLIADLSEGFPHFLQQFAFCAFDHDTDNIIDKEDVNAGTFKSNGAIDQLGKRLFNSMYFDSINSNDYRTVLRFMADRSLNWVSKKDLRALAMKEHTLANALNALKDRGIILPRPGKKGEYRLPTKAFATWIKLFSEQAHMLPSQGDS